MFCIIVIPVINVCVIRVPNPSTERNKNVADCGDACIAHAQWEYRARASL